MENPPNFSIRVESSEEGFARFDAVTSDSAQQARVRKIHLEVLFAPTNVKPLKKMQSNAETAANNGALTRATAALFGRLATWGPRSAGGGIKLTLGTAYFSHPSCIEGEQIYQGTWWKAWSGLSNCLGPAYLSYMEVIADACGNLSPEWYYQALGDKAYGRGIAGGKSDPYQFC
ncbi:hypothetical protein PG987_015461 [Apiospora arundinis]